MSGVRKGKGEKREREREQYRERKGKKEEEREVGGVLSFKEISYCLHSKQNRNHGAHNHILEQNLVCDLSALLHPFHYLLCEESLK